MFDIQALLHSALSVRVPGCQNYKWWLNPVWHRMLYSCTHIATVGIKGLIVCVKRPETQAAKSWYLLVCLCCRRYTEDEHGVPAVRPSRSIHLLDRTVLQRLRHQPLCWVVLSVCGTRHEEGHRDAQGKFTLLCAIDWVLLYVLMWASTEIHPLNPG